MSLDPSSLHLKNMQQWEQVKLVLQRHWFALVYTFWYFIFLVASVIVVVSFSSSITFVSANLINLMLVIYISVFLLFIYINWMRYELDVFIITNKRVIWLEEVAFLNRHVSECLIDKIQEVNVQTTWLFSNLLNFWRVTLHTASETSDFVMEILPDAIDNARRISNVINESKQTQNITN